MTMRSLQTATAIVEAGAALALLGVPSVTAWLLLGAPLDAPVAVSLVRVGGVAILALSIVSWLARADAQSLASRGVVIAMLFYNIAVASVLLFARFGHGLYGMLLWPAVAFHVAMGVWCVLSLLGKDEGLLR
ncbi:hypothetical protein AB4Z10_25685 [Bosea sp. RAF48]|uniref:hypothetical protein n=1 Tax=Bosea sp. RAF48 TaxID=3237480 RepID=UPI003F9181E7